MAVYPFWIPALFAKDPVLFARLPAAYCFAVGRTEESRPWISAASFSLKAYHAFGSPFHGALPP